MPALLSPDPQVSVTRLGQRLGRELALLAFDFLQAQHVGRLLESEALQVFDPEADGVDVPRSDPEAHSKPLADRAAGGNRRERRLTAPGAQARRSFSDRRAGRSRRRAARIGGSL